MAESLQSGSTLRRSLSLPMLVLYGIGTTVGAGIYALLGEISAEAGALAPWSFLLASIMASFTALSFAELARRFPQSAATAMYVQQGLRLRWLALVVGLLVAVAGVVSSAALLNGMVNYLQPYVDMPSAVLLVTAVVLLMLLACWGIAQSVWVAVVICVAEVGGLIWISGLAAAAVDLGAIDWAPLVPNLAALPAVTGAAVLAFYAYIGFEDMVEVAEEVRDVTRTLPRAIIVTLVATTLLYLTLVLSAQFAVSAATLATFQAPLADLYQYLTGRDPVLISAIGIVAIVNGVLIQMIMASRVIYGLASRSQLPVWLSKVHPRTRTPVRATVLTAGAIGVLALTGSLAGLAEFTSVVMLTVFALANLSLWRLKRRDQEVEPPPGRRLPAIIPLLGFLICLAMVIRTIVVRLW